MPAHNHKVYWKGYWSCDSGSAKTCMSRDWMGGDPEREMTCDNKGGGQPHNNLPPYITVYMYKRIA